jgi:hypothetical protein
MHWPKSGQVTTAVPAQPPAPLQTSFWVLALPSLQPVPEAAWLGVHPTPLVV